LPYLKFFLSFATRRNLLVEEDLLGIRDTGLKRELKSAQKNSNKVARRREEGALH
jgi:hypothetical protein